MSYQHINKELHKAIEEIEYEATRGFDGNDCSHCYAQGLEDAIRMLGNFRLLVSELSLDEALAEAKARNMKISDKQKKLL